MVPTELDIPDKRRFKIGEVAKLLDLEPYVLRYWETEFEVLAPEKTKSGQRVYRVEDIELVHTIRHLLYDEMFTIAGARRQLELQREGKPCLLNGPGASASPELLSRVERAEAERALLGRELDSARRELDRISQERDELRRSARREGAERERQLEALRGELEAVCEQRDDAQSQVDGITATVEALQNEKREAEGLGRRLKALEAEHESLELEHLELSSHAKDLREEARASQTALAKVQAQRDGLRAHLDARPTVSPELLGALRREVTELRAGLRRD